MMESGRISSVFSLKVTAGKQDGKLRMTLWLPASMENGFDLKKIVPLFQIE